MSQVIFQQLTQVVDLFCLAILLRILDYIDLRFGKLLQYFRNKYLLLLFLYFDPCNRGHQSTSSVGCSRNLSRMHIKSGSIVLTQKRLQFENMNEPDARIQLYHLFVYSYLKLVRTNLNYRGIGTNQYRRNFSVK